MIYSRKIFILLSCISIYACNKSEKQSISGRILQNCDNASAFAEVPLSLYYLDKGVPGLGGVTRRSFEYQTTTNKDGIFTFNFEEKSWSAIGDNGTYGAELMVDGKLVMSGIASSDQHLGDVYYGFRSEVEVYAAISSRGLSPGDSVFIGEQFIGSGNFPAVVDTLTARVCNQSDPDNYGLPVYDELRSACLYWQIRQGDSVVENGFHRQRLEADCDGSVSTYFVVEP